MLIKFEANQDLVKQVRQLTGQRAGSKAFHKASALAVEQQARLQDLQNEVARLRAITMTQRQILLSSREAARQLLEHVSQDDLVLESSQP